MKVFCINEVNFGSTGRIMEQIVKAAGVEYRLGVAESRSNRKQVQAGQVFIRDRYPSSHVDNTRLMWKRKKKWFTGVRNLTIVPPSHWLGGLVKASFLKEYPVQVIHNGIDLHNFHPVEGNFRERYGIPEKTFVLLGVTFGWEERKGLDVFLELSRRLEQDAFKIVLVGTDEKVDRLLPEQIVSIHRTADQRELAGIYSAADLFVNPTREDNYPTVNMEAIACGTPVLTFCTGGSPESVGERTGKVVPCGDVDAMEREIRRICGERPYRKEECATAGQAFDMQRCFRGYAEVYETVTRENRDC